MRRDGGLSAIRKSFVRHQANPAATMTFLIDTPLSPGLGVHVPIEARIRANTLRGFQPWLTFSLLAQSDNGRHIPNQRWNP